MAPTQQVLLMSVLQLFRCVLASLIEGLSIRHAFYIKGNMKKAVYSTMGDSASVQKIENFEPNIPFYLSILHFFAKYTAYSFPLFLI